MKITPETKLKVGDVVDSRTILAILEPVYFLSMIKKPFYGGTHCHRDQLNGLELEEKEWSPEELKEGDVYWSIAFFSFSRCIKAVDYFFTNDEADNWRIKSGNCFRSQEEAEAYYKKIMEK